MLQALGLSPTAQALYEKLLVRSPTTLTGSQWTPAVAAAMRHLISLGLVTELPADPPQYRVVPVHEALDALIAARARALALARERVDQLAAAYHSSDGVEVVQGRDAVLDRVERLTYGTCHEMRVFDAPPYLSEPGDANAAELHQLDRGVRHRVIYHPRGVDLRGRPADIEDGIAHGEEARVADVPLKLLISDRAAAMLPMSGRPESVDSWLVVRDPALIGGLSALFESYWARAVPLRAAIPPEESGPTDLDRSLLPLLAAGLTDRAIAEHLELHERTVHRHLRTMMRRLGVATRFQAGYQAARKGWLTAGGADG